MLKHKQLQDWIDSVADLCQPENVVICDGSKDEYDRMWRLLMDAGVAKPLNSERRPRSYLVRSDPGDVARVEDKTFSL